MRNNRAIVITDAIIFAHKLKDIMGDAGLNVSIAVTDSELTDKIQKFLPRFIFLENCFHRHEIEAFIQQIVKRYAYIDVTVWAVSDVKPVTAARYIAAGAESFLSLRETENNVETAICRIAGGRHYRPADVEAVLDKKDEAYPVIGVELTQREIQVAKLASKGLKNREIGDALSITIHTVKFHKENIYRKCGGNTSVDILSNGLKMGVVNKDDLEE